MKITETITTYIKNLKDYINSELDLLKLSAMRKIGNLLGLIFSAIFVMFLFHITIALIGIWVGFWLSEVYDSTSIGFGITVLIYMLWTIISIVFRRTLLVKPFSKLILKTMLEIEEQEKLEQLQNEPTDNEKA